MQRQPQNDQHDHDGADAIADRTVLNRGVFLVRHRDRPGQPDLRAIGAREIKLPCGITNGVRRILARLQRLIVEDRLEFDESAAVGRRQRLVADKFTPGESRGAFLQNILDRLGNQAEGCGRVFQLGLPALDAGKTGFERPGQTADRRITRHDLDEGSRGSELPGNLAHFLDRKKQQPVLFKELARTERRHRFKILLVA